MMLLCVGFFPTISFYTFNRMRCVSSATSLTHKKEDQNEINKHFGIVEQILVSLACSMTFTRLVQFKSVTLLTPELFEFTLLLLLLFSPNGWCYLGAKPCNTFDGKFQFCLLNESENFKWKCYFQYVLNPSQSSLQRIFFCILILATSCGFPNKINAFSLLARKYFSLRLSARYTLYSIKFDGK